MTLTALPLTGDEVVDDIDLGWNSSRTGAVTYNSQETMTVRLLSILVDSEPLFL